LLFLNGPGRSNGCRLAMQRPTKKTRFDEGLETKLSEKWCERAVVDQ